MATKAIQPGTVTDKLIGRWEQVGQKLVTIAEEIPENKLDFRPVDGTRTVADVLRHVAFWNHYVADRTRGKMGSATANQLPESEFSTKEQILEALKRSNADCADALRELKSGLNPEMAEMLVSFIEHNSEHYGQLVVYARLNEIVPPASRG
jgi:uncharacterized damage-inducible protein DinB